MLWGKGGSRGLLCTFRGPCWRERLLSFINDSDSREPLVRSEIEGLGLARGLPKGEGEPSPSRRECGTAGLPGVAVFERRSGAETFFLLLLFQVNTLPRPPLAPSTPPPSFSPAHVFLFKGCSADEYDWHLQPPLDFQLKPLEWRRSWAAKGRAVSSLGLLGGWLSCGFILLLPRIFLSEWEQGLWKPCWEEVYFLNPSWNCATNSLFWLILHFFFLPFFLLLLSNVPLCCWVVGQRRLFLYGQPFGDMLRAKVVCWFAWLWWQVGLLWIGWTEVALKEPWLEAGLRLAFSLPQVLMLALNPWSWSNMWWCPTMRSRRTLRSACRLERLWMS